MSLDISHIVRMNRQTINAIRNEEKLQGHFLTGELDKSFEGTEYMEGNTLVLEAYAADYVEDLEERTEARDINVSEQEFQHLVQWVQRRGLNKNGESPVAIASMIVQRWELEGRPTVNSRQYSKTGERTGAIEKILVIQEDKFFLDLGTAIDKIFEPVFSQQKSEVV